jgi:hypothetical protein
MLTMPRPLGSVRIRSFRSSAGSPKQALAALALEPRSERWMAAIDCALISP